MVADSVPPPVDPDSDPKPAAPLATPQVVPRTDAFGVGVEPVHWVMSPNPSSRSADSVRVSSAPLVFFTSTPYLTVAQILVVLTEVFVVVAVLGASVDVTVTGLEFCGPNDVPPEAPWPVTLTMFFTVKFSA